MATYPGLINVASVPQRSPFRYPGGKTWFIPYLRRWLLAQPASPVQEFIEPFAGGGSASLTAVAEGLVEHAIMAELDEAVVAVWQTILSDEAGWLAQRLVQFELTEPALDFILEQEPLSMAERAFQTILKNRVSYGGIMAQGAGRMKQQGGILARWYPQTLKKRILDIAKIGHRLTFIHGDGLAVMRQNLKNYKALFFIDPPYTVAGKKAGRRLYAHSDLDHAALFDIAAHLAGDFLMTYDDSRAVRELAWQYGFETQGVVMQTGHKAKMTELMIGRNLAWARGWREA